MSSWMEEYLQALEERDTREKAQVEYIDACTYTKLADRTAALETHSKTRLPGSSPVSLETVKNASKQGAVRPGKSTPGREDDTVQVDVLNQLRADLAATQKSRADLQARLKPLVEELESLKSESKKSLRKISELSREKHTLERKLRDRDEELKGKARLVEEVQDEMLSLNLQLNLAEQRLEKLQQENKELIDRWMARMGKEADAMNDASKWT
ncbi:MAG: hypothetical protein M1821_000008 [Bathelium mastoideum]|nr:MAG: hypothetical protein M1821_000008 [Bathelium mastoideum]KAI9687962.1 MAG: hypothetical protein M1822_002044 [Bathelium mastoideum]